MPSVDFVIDLIPHAFQTNGSVSAADFLAYSGHGRGATGTAAYFYSGLVLVAFAWVASGKKRWIGIVVGIVGVVLLILGLIQWHAGRTMGFLWGWFDE